jgi:hypothetical protein
MPRSPQTSAQAPIGVSKRVKDVACIAMMNRLNRQPCQTP